MVKLQKEKEFFQKAAELVFQLVASFENEILTIKYKKRPGVISDPVTSSDIAIENLLTKKINHFFPDDAILGEESSSDLKINPRVRTWILDPICGTTNYSRGVRNFCTNIAIAHKNSIVGACVIDHGRNEYIWSTGNKEIYINNSLAKEINHSVPLIDVDLGGSYYAKDKRTKRKYTNFLYRILTETNFIPVSYNTSLGFAYTAIGRLDGYFVTAPHVWDVAAANFLLIQSGGTVSDISGKPWNLNSKSVLAARDSSVHKKLLDIYRRS